MLTTIELLVILGACWGLAYARASLVIWIPALTAVLLGASLFSTLPWWLLITFWILFLIPTTIVAIPQLRKLLISRLFFRRAHKLALTISETEQQTIESGDIWWEAELFSGRPDWKKLQSIQIPSLSSEEQAFLDNQVDTLCSMIDDWKIVQEDKDLPKAVWKYIKDEGFLGMTIPKEYGGLGFSALAHSTVVMKLSSRSISAAVDVMLPNAVGPAELLLKYGSEEQRKAYLPKLASGKEIPCLALTEPDAGSDVSEMKDSGIICRDQYEGSEIIGIKLNWNKRYVTLAPIATVIVLAFKLFDPDHLLGDKKELGVTLCLVPTSYDGVEIGNRHLPLNLGFMNGPTRGNDVFIPFDSIIGGATMVGKGAGKGWQMLMECFTTARAISLPAMACGTAKHCYRTTGAYARIRRQFKSSIGHFEGVSEVLAKIGGLTYMLEACRLMTLSAIDNNIKPTIVSAIAKCHMTEMSRTISNHAMDIHAGRGIQLGPRNYLALHHQSIPLGITVEGSNILTRNLIIFGQSAIRCHPYLQAEIEATKEKDLQQGLHKFDQLLFSHTGYFLSNIARSLVNGFTGGIFLKAPVSGITAKYYRRLTRMSAALAFVTDLSMATLGGTIKSKERLSARLGDVLSYLYLGSTVLKYYQDNRSQREELPYLHWALQTCLFEIQNAFSNYIANFPKRWAAAIMKFCIFPLGRHYKKPADYLEQGIAATMLEPSELRDRISQHTYDGKTAEDPTGRIEDALHKLVAANQIDKKLQNAIKAGRVPRQGTFDERVAVATKAGILTEREVETLRKYEEARLDAIQVDEFALDYFTKKTTTRKKTATKAKKPSTSTKQSKPKTVEKAKEVLEEK